MRQTLFGAQGDTEERERSIDVFTQKCNLPKPFQQLKHVPLLTTAGSTLDFVHR